jgi:DNA-binding response OmpR family regulator
VEKLFNNSLTIKAQDSWKARYCLRLKVKTVMVSCLLIDNNAGECNRIATLLQELGIQSTTIVDIEEGIRFAHANTLDVVLMEASVAPRSKEFLRLLRHQGRNTGRPVVILYAPSASMEDMGEGILSGASEFMMAPFDLSLLEFKLVQSGVLTAKAA